MSLVDMNGAADCRETPGSRDCVFTSSAFFFFLHFAQPFARLKLPLLDLRSGTCDMNTAGAIDYDEPFAFYLFAVCFC